MRICLVAAIPSYGTFPAVAFVRLPPRALCLVADIRVNPGSNHMPAEAVRAVRSGQVRLSNGTHRSATLSQNFSVPTGCIVRNPTRGTPIPLPWSAQIADGFLRSLLPLVANRYGLELSEILAPKLSRHASRTNLTADHEQLTS